ncbi:conserved hypothetical protein [Candidatus Methylobacter favarea]|uniref:AlpA family phage regulatory protein n=1 Tax=Candidatus Methylobacter favarea TaxID=2707345 RepID=A0A8S0WK63_9GAMM|nr:AlpA family phage regulatory protein [Candidatus Methylobacter favarea]CAA9891748.1 conserved hypothetical protein [Candidatus Methylobacter favarea]
MQSSRNKNVLRIPATCKKMGIGRNTLYALVKADKYPKPIRFSEKSVGFLEYELDDRIDAKAAERK